MAKHPHLVLHREFCWIHNSRSTVTKYFDKIIQLFSEFVIDMHWGPCISGFLLFICSKLLLAISFYTSLTSSFSFSDPTE